MRRFERQKWLAVLDHAVEHGEWRLFLETANCTIGGVRVSFSHLGTFASWHVSFAHAGLLDLGQPDFAELSVWCWSSRARVLSRLYARLVAEGRARAKTVDEVLATIRAESKGGE